MISGYLNGTDIKLIREMAGSDENGNENWDMQGDAGIIDLRNAQIVAGGIPYTKVDILTDITEPNKIGMRMFTKWHYLEELYLPTSTTEIGDEAFAYCYEMPVLVIPDGVVSIGDYAMAGLDSIRTFTMPAQLIALGNSAMINCNNLKSIYLNSKLATIGDDAFRGTQSLTEVHIRNAVSPKVASGRPIFDDITHQSAPLYVPVGSKTDYQSNTIWSPFRTILEESSGVSTTVETPTFTVYADNGTLHIDNVPAGEIVRIYNMQGLLIESTTSVGEPISITLHTNNIYFVNIGNNSQKVKL